MAAIFTTESNTGQVRSRKTATRIDMTPMVDLGFLLITFFILATTLNKPIALQLNVPNKIPPKSDALPIKASSTMTVFLVGNGQVRYMLGKAASQHPVVKTVSMGYNFRKALFDAQRQIPANQLVVIVKPTNTSTYKILVDALDELAIARINRYALVPELTPDEKTLLKTVPGNNII